MRRINIHFIHKRITLLSLIIFLLIHAKRILFTYNKYLLLYDMRNVHRIRKPYFLSRLSIPPYRSPLVLIFICRKMVVEGQEDLY